MAQIEEEKKVADKEREEMLANFEKHRELERQQQEKIRKVSVTQTKIPVHYCIYCENSKLFFF